VAIISGGVLFLTWFFRILYKVGLPVIEEGYSDAEKVDDK
jgi:hypothetical protein